MTRVTSTNCLAVNGIMEELRRRCPSLSVSGIHCLRSRKLLAPSHAPNKCHLCSSHSVRHLRAVLCLRGAGFLPLDIVGSRLSNEAARRRDAPRRVFNTSHRHTSEVDPRLTSRVRPVSEVPRLLNMDLTVIEGVTSYKLVELIHSPTKESLIHNRSLRLVIAYTRLARFNVRPGGLHRCITTTGHRAPVFRRTLTSVSQRRNRDRNRQTLEERVALSEVLRLAKSIEQSLVEERLLKSRHSH